MKQKAYSRYANLRSAEQLLWNEKWVKEDQVLGHIVDKRMTFEFIITQGNWRTNCSLLKSSLSCNLIKPECQVYLQKTLPSPLNLNFCSRLWKNEEEKLQKTSSNKPSWQQLQSPLTWVLLFGIYMKQFFEMICFQ